MIRSTDEVVEQKKGLGACNSRDLARGVKLGFCLKLGVSWVYLEAALDFWMCQRLKVTLLLASQCPALASGKI